MPIQACFCLSYVVYLFILFPFHIHFITCCFFATSFSHKGFPSRSNETKKQTFWLLSFSLSQTKLICGLSIFATVTWMFSSYFCPYKKFHANRNYLFAFLFFALLTKRQVDTREKATERQFVCSDYPHQQNFGEYTFSRRKLMVFAFSGS